MILLVILDHFDFLPGLMVTYSIGDSATVTYVPYNNILPYNNEFLLR